MKVYIQLSTNGIKYADIICQRKSLTLIEYQINSCIHTLNTISVDVVVVKYYFYGHQNDKKIQVY